MRTYENECHLIGHYGSDWTHACSAWTSTERELNDEKRGRMPALLKMLAEKGHHTPFEKSSLHFLVTAEIASHIHCLKHRIAVSINAESARYKELKEDKWHIPSDWPTSEKNRLNEHCSKCFTEYHDVLDRLINVHGMERKRAKESSRFYLPYASQIQFDIMMNWRSFHHFLGLRKKKDAQKEVHDIAAHMLWCVKSIEGNPFEHTIAAFGYDSVN